MRTLHLLPVALAAALLVSPAAAARGTAVDVAPLQERVDRAGLLPPGTRVVAAVRAGRTLHVDLDLGRPYDPREHDDLTLAAHHALGDPDVRGVFVRVPDEDGVFRPLPWFLPDVPVPDKGGAIDGPPVDLPGWGEGALAGKTVYLSQCHGWYWHESYQDWYTQRPNLFDTAEDFHNPEGMDQYLMRYLLGAGARVVPIRESDLNEQMVIVDDADAGYGEDGAFADGGASGFASGQGPYAYGVDPFELGGTRVADTAGTVTATASWTPDVPADGYYQVYVSYGQDPSRAPDAHYVVRHPGADTHVFVDQRIHGSTWVYLGRFYFYAGSDPLLGSVELRNDSATAGATVSADAVRLGGGMGDVSRGGAPSGHERWEEAAIYSTQYLGAPTSVYDPYGDGDGSDPSSRSRFADYEHEAGEDAVYYSWHSNAGGGSGTSTFVYSECDVGYDCEFSGVEGSDVLAEFIHDDVVDAVRALWDADWTDRGLHTAWFAEVNPSYNDEMPAALIELAFHDHEGDTALLKHPRFRRDTSRAMMHGIIDYFADRDGVDLEYPPEPPTHLSVRASGTGELTVRWQAPPAGAPLGDPATGYRVYTSADGRAFDDGIDVDGTEWVLGGQHGYEPVFVRVTATNAGGESFPTETLGAIPTPEETAIAFVQGFDRLDRGLLLYRDAGGNVGWLTHMDLDRMNRYDYAVEHLWALAALGVPADGLSQELIVDGAVDAGDYAMVAWAAGQESTEDESFGAEEQAWVRDFRDGGGGLFVTGGEIGWDLDSHGGADDIAFYEEVLLARLLEDDAGTYSMAPAGTGLFAGLAAMAFDDGTHGTYDVDYPDVLDPQGDAEVVLLYDGDPAAPAGIAAAGLVYLGVPFEAILDAGARDDVMAAAVGHLLPGYAPPEWPEGDDDDAADDDASDDDAGGLLVGPPLQGGCRCAAARPASGGTLALLAALAATGWLHRRRFPGHRR